MRYRLIIVILCWQNVFAQDINFSQFYELPLLRNPGLAGVYKGDIRVTSAFRTQWGSVTTPYKTAALGVETKRSMGENSNDFMSFGVQLTTDNAGDSKLTKSQGFGMFAYHKSVSRERDSYITAGFLGGGVQQHFDVAALKFGDQFVAGAYTPTNPTRQNFSRTQLFYWDASAGISFSTVFWENTRCYIGAAYFHFTEPKVAFNAMNDISMNKKIVVNAGLSTPLSEFNWVILYGDFFRQGGSSQLQGGLLYRHNILQEDSEDDVSLSAGAFYRWNDAIIPVVKLTYYKLGIGFTYDVNMSKLYLGSHGRGGAELTLSYQNFLNVNKTSAMKLRCPKGI
jgi:type IX secretion system PorP/SprF family membrane protein